MRVLLIALALLCVALTSSATGPWPEAAVAGAGTTSASHGQLFMRNNTSVFYTHSATGWEHPTPDSYTDQLSSDGCFTEPSDGVLKWTCADADLAVHYSLTYNAGGINGLATGTSMKIRAALSTDATCTTYGFMYANYEPHQGFITVDGEAAYASRSIIVNVPQGRCIRVEINPGAVTTTTADDGLYEALLLSAEKIGGVAGADADLATDLPTNTAIVSGGAPFITKASSATLTALEMSGGVIHNKGAVGEVILTLGSATCTQGYNFSVLHYAAQAIKLEPNGTDQILNLTDTAGDFLVSDGVATSTATCGCVETGGWLCALSGGWTEQ